MLAGHARGAGLSAFFAPLRENMFEPRNVGLS